MNHRKKFFLPFAATILTIGIIEIISYLGIKVFDARNHLKTLYSFIPEAFDKLNYYDDFIDSNRFDSDLGWDEQFVIRGNPKLNAGEKHFASVFGDSMTFCEEVPFEKSWPYLLENKINRKILNMGVPGYGTDQSLLKFIKYYHKYPTDYAILGILPDDINRLLMVVPNYRWKSGPIVTKPRFIIKQNEIKLLKNPLHLPQDLYRLLDTTFLKKISLNDECYQYYINRYGFNSISGRTFPYTKELFQALAGFIRYGPAPYTWGSPYELYKEGSDSLRLMEFIVNKFIKQSHEFGCTPIIMIHCDLRSDINNLIYLNSLLEFIAASGCFVINVRDLLLPELVSGSVDLHTLLAPGGHYSFFANQIIAQKLSIFFNLLIKGNENDVGKYYYDMLNTKINYSKIQL